MIGVVSVVVGLACCLCFVLFNKQRKFVLCCVSIVLNKIGKQVESYKV